MKKLILVALFLLVICTQGFTQEPIIVKGSDSKDTTLNWMRKPANVAPYRYDMVVKFTDVFGDTVQSTIQGLDIRKFDTEEKAIQEAKYRLKIEPRPAMQSIHDYTKEQNKALQDFNNAQNYYNNAKNLVETEAVTEEEVKLKEHRDKIREKYLQCIELGIDVWSPCCQ